MEPRIFDVAGQLRLVVSIRSGDIRITGSNDDKAAVRVTGERVLDDISIDAETSTTGTVLHVRQPEEVSLWGLHGRGVEVDLAVPAGTVADIVTGSGDLEVDCPLAELAFQAGSGDAQVGDVTGSLRVKSASGDVRTGAIDGDVSFTTAAGDVSIGSIGGNLNGRSASGDIEVGVLARAGRLASASGDITIGSASGDLELRSVSGDIEVGVPAGSRVWFDLSSASGDASSELELGEASGADAASTIRATSVSGDVRIRRAPRREANAV
jgi:DUF4097 and DUF4098 domain-containing protein YvlB